MEIGSIAEIVGAASAAFIGWRTYLFTKQQDERDRDPELIFVLTNKDVSEEDGWPQGYSVMAVNNSCSNSIVLKNPYKYWMIKYDCTLDRYIKEKKLPDPLGKEKFTADVLVGPGEAKVLCTFEKDLWKLLKDSKERQISLLVSDIVTKKDHKVIIHYVQNKTNSNKGHLEIAH